MNTSRYMTRAQSSRLVKRILKESYPGVAFSVTTSDWTLNIHSTDGPGRDEVEDLLGVFKSGYFDGMIDTYIHEGSDIAYAGQIVQRFQYVCVERTWTAPVTAQIEARLEPETLAAWKRQLLGYSGGEELARVRREVVEMLHPLQPSKTLGCVKPVPQDKPLDAFLETQRESCVQLPSAMH
ncbi:MAG: hypothetical protein IPJ18_20245 [Betaproteobacteria bacterium]|nr:hypothetical protein [Betaproteobacteria bacterium]